MLTQHMKNGIRRKLQRLAETANVRGVQATYVGNDRLIVKLPDGLHLIAVASDLSITPELVTNGMYDWPFWYFLRRVLRPGDHAVDVGANIGLFTLAMAGSVGPSGHVTAFEPDEMMADLIRDNLQANWVADRATIVSAAAGRAAGEITFQRHSRFLGSSSAGAANFEGHAITDGYESVTVPVVRLDERVQGHVRLIKVDVEGGEAAVLLGAGGVTADFWDIEVILGMAHDEDELLQALRELPGMPHLHRGDGTLRQVTFDHIVERRGAPHVVFAEPSVVKASGL